MGESSYLTFSNIFEHPWLSSISKLVREDIQADSEKSELLREYLLSIENGNLPENFKNFIQFGNALLDQSCCELARQAYKLGLSKEDRPLIWNNIGFAYAKEESFEKSVPYFKASLNLNPNFSLPRNNLANSLIKMAIKLTSTEQEENINLAEAFLFESLSFKPNHDWAFLNLGNVWNKRNNSEMAMLWYKMAIQSNQNYATAHNNLAHNLLARGNFLEGFKHYEYRWDSSDFPTKQARIENIPYWDGVADLNNKSILLHWEQGFGDMIQFCRYTWLLRSLFPRAYIVLESMEPLLPLFKQLSSLEGFENKSLTNLLPPVDLVVSNNRSLQNNLKIDFVYPLMSLAKVFTKDEASIPSFSSYLTRPIPSREWEEFITSPRQENNKLIAIQWAGRPTHGNDRRRSVSLDTFRPLLEAGQKNGYKFFSIQTGEAKKQINEFGLEGLITDLSSKINSFADAAMILKDMDFCISVDTAYLHLAGALGVNSIGLIPLRSDFRWLKDRTDSPWYPSLRLIRQKKDLVWEGVTNEILEIIKE